MRWLRISLAVSLFGAALAAACGSSSEESQFTPDGGGGDDGSVFVPPIFDPNGNDGAIGPDASALSISPADPIVTFSGGALPTVTFVAKNAAGAQVPATFQIDRGEIGSETQAGVFTATGIVGGKATVTATWQGHSATTSVTVKLAFVQNGETVVADAGADGGGAGGYGGVGGEGPGGAVTADQMTALKSAPTNDGAKFLYPYDKTVWPRGILPPLLQWQPGTSTDYDAVRIEITENAYTFDGYFARPTGATPFRRHPVPQQAWKQMLASNQGEDVTIKLTLAKGTASYGPITQTWKIASAPLKGVVYYNSYGTKLAKNFTGAQHPPGGSGAFGAATLAIRGGSTDPELIAGESGGQDKCRVCHSVAANGSVLITQRDLGDARQFSTYDLKTKTETTMSPEGTAADYAWSAIYPDGSMFLGDSSTAAGSRVTPNKLFSIVSGAGPQAPALIPTPSWPSGFNAAYPSFSPDGKHLAFTMYSGATGADTKSIGTMTFDATTKTFGALTPLYTPADPTKQTAIFVSFLPTNDAIIFELETTYNGRDYGGTRSRCDDFPPLVCATTGTHAELWWLDLKTKTAHPLDKLNGEGYLPVDATSAHDDDTSLNYEPTVNPVPSGGYAWVVFTSRRLYGNVATINPFFSDPRYNDLTSTPTPKKLWVAAIDLNAPPGTDPSHPAFYLPAQELLAGNSRGYWVVDPCHSDGTSCETGDECCGGYCRPAGDGGALVCSAQVPVCAQEFEKCSADGDCCNSAAYKCINNRCALPLPK